MTRNSASRARNGGGNGARSGAGNSAGGRAGVPTGSENLTVTEASRLGVSDLVRRASQGNDIIVERHGTPMAAVVGVARFQELEELEADLRSAALVLARLATDNGERVDLDTVIVSLGFDRAELEAELDADLRAGYL